MKNKTNPKIQIKYILLLLPLLLSVLLASKWLPKNSLANDAKDLEIEAHLEKYINYEISKNDKGTIIAYQIKHTPIQDNQNSQIELKVNRIDELYPNYIKVLNKQNGIEKKSEYNKESGTITIQTEKQNNEYIIFCNYETDTQQEQERELALQVNTKTTTQQQNEENIVKETSKNFSVTVKENIGELTSIQYQTKDIYDGYMKSNQINGTNYNTTYQEKQQITISKKSYQDKLVLVENNTFNNKNLIYKNTKITEENIKNLLGEDGTLEILNQNQEILETINKDTNWEENGSYTINYENQPEELIIKTSKIQNEGILILEHEKQIKAETSTIEQNQITTKTNLIGIQEIENPQENKIEEKQIYNKNNEKTIEIKNAKTNITMDTNTKKWTNKQQNEVIFEIQLNSNTPKDNLFKNPSIKIKLPKEVEKVIIQNSSIFYENGLELQEPYTQTDENGEIQIITNLEGQQTEYCENNLQLATNIKITATVILKKDIKNEQAKINLEYSNQYTENEEIEIETKETRNTN